MSAHLWHDVPPRHHDERHGDSLQVVVEVPKGCKVKYEVDKPTGLLRVDRVLHSAVHYPQHYGFVPQTYFDDGDPIDALVIGSEPVAPGCILLARAVGLMRMEDAGEQDDKLICVHVGDPAFEGFRELDDLPKHVTKEIRRFFLDYKLLEGTAVDVVGVQGRQQAEAAVERSIVRYADNRERLRAGSITESGAGGIQD